MNFLPSKVNYYLIQFSRRVTIEIPVKNNKFRFKIDQIDQKKTMKFQLSPLNEIFMKAPLQKKYNKKELPKKISDVLINKM